MDDPLPEIVTNIASRVSGKYAGRFRSVSKAWYFLLKTPNFILTHLRQALKNPNLLLLLSNNSRQGIDVTIFDGQVAPQQGQLRLPGININTPRNRYKVEASSDGLLLLSLIRCCTPLELLLLNPTLGRMRTLPAFPIDAPTDSSRASFCLGFDPASKDYKVISFLSFRKYRGFYDFMHDDDKEEEEEEEPKDMKEHKEGEEEEDDDVEPPYILPELFSLRSGTWKELPACDVPGAYYDSASALSHNGSFYWLANPLEEVEGQSFLLSFHMKTEVFTKMPMPGSGAYSIPMRKRLAVYNDSLAIIFHPYFDRTETVPINLWVMKDTGDGGHGVLSSWSWTKLYSIGPLIDVGATTPLGVWRNEIIIQFGENCYNNGVFSYNCDTGERKYLVIPAAEPPDEDFFYLERRQVYNHVESLVDPLNWGKCEL